MVYARGHWAREAWPLPAPLPFFAHKLRILTPRVTRSFRSVAHDGREQVQLAENRATSRNSKHSLARVPDLGGLSPLRSDIFG